MTFIMDFNSIHLNPFNAHCNVFLSIKVIYKYFNRYFKQWTYEEQYEKHKGHRRSSSVLEETAVTFWADIHGPQMIFPYNFGAPQIFPLPQVDRHVHIWKS